MKPHNVLIIGCGSIGERNLRCFMTTGRAEICCCDTDESLLVRIQDRYGVKVTTDWEAAIRDSNLTAVVVATPAHLHVEMATAAMEAGVATTTAVRFESRMAASQTRHKLEPIDLQS